MRGNNLALNIKGEVIGKGSSSKQTINYHYCDGLLMDEERESFTIS